jgi:hypothetical protein
VSSGPPPLAGASPLGHDGSEGNEHPLNEQTLEVIDEESGLQSAVWLGDLIGPRDPADDPWGPIFSKLEAVLFADDDPAGSEELVGHLMEMQQSLKEGPSLSRLAVEHAYTLQAHALVRISDAVEDPDEKAILLRGAFDDVFSLTEMALEDAWQGQMPARARLSTVSWRLAQVTCALTAQSGDKARLQKSVALLGDCSEACGRTNKEVAAAAAAVASAAASRGLQDCAITEPRAKDVSIAETAASYLEVLGEALRIALYYLKADVSGPPHTEMFIGCMDILMSAVQLSENLSEHPSVAFHQICSLLGEADDLVQALQGRYGTDLPNDRISEASARLDGVGATSLLRIWATLSDVAEPDVHQMLESAALLPRRLRDSVNEPVYLDSGTVSGESQLDPISLLQVVFDTAERDVVVHRLMGAIGEGLKASESADGVVAEDKDREWGVEELLATVYVGLAALPDIAGTFRSENLVTATAAALAHFEISLTEEPLRALVVSARGGVTSGEEFPLAAYTALRSAKIQNAPRYLQQVEELVFDKILPAFGTDQMVPKIVSELLNHASANSLFLVEENAAGLLQLADKLLERSEFQTSVFVNHAVNRALFMLSLTRGTVRPRLAERSREMLLRLNFRPTPQNRRFSTEVLESLRFFYRSAEVSAERSPEISAVSNDDFDVQRIGEYILDWIRDPQLDDEQRLQAELVLRLLPDIPRPDAPETVENLPPSLTQDYPRLMLAQLLRKGREPIEPEGTAQAMQAVRAILRQPLLQLGDLRALADVLWPTGAEHLGFSDDVRLEIASAVHSAEISTQREAAVAAIAVAQSLTDLMAQGQRRPDAEQLAEAFAARFLPAALTDGPIEVEVVEFLRIRLGAAIHDTANPNEFLWRRIAAVACYALARQSGDLDLAGVLAYLNGEYYRLTGASQKASWWYGLFDYWRDKGALEDPSWEDFLHWVASDRAAAQRGNS